MRTITKATKDGDHITLEYLEDDGKTTTRSGNYPALHEIFNNFPAKDTDPSDELDAQKPAAEVKTKV